MKNRLPRKKKKKYYKKIKSLIKKYDEGGERVVIDIETLHKYGISMKQFLKRIH